MATVNSNPNRRLLANGLVAFLINGNHFFRNRPRSLPRYPPDLTISLKYLRFDILISVDKLFAETLQKFATRQLIINYVENLFHHQIVNHIS